MAKTDRNLTSPRASFRRAARLLFAAVLALPAAAQTTITESFTGTTAEGWIFGGTGYSPVLTANTVDNDGDGWLRLTSGSNGNQRIENQATYALFDTELFSVNAQIQIEIEYAFYNGGNENDVGHGAGFPFAPGAVGDGITFFLVDGSVNSSSFSAGAYGGSLGYANMDSSPGMTGGYLGFGFDNFGNFAAANEGKQGGVDISTQGPVSNGLSIGDRDAGYANVIGVRGPESSDYAYIDSSGDLRDIAHGGEMYIDSATRPDQTGEDYRSFRLTLDANNQLLVEMKFGVDGPWVTAFTADLSTFDRPETFKIGFTAGTGGAWSTQEVRNVQVTTTPWSAGPGAYEWDNEAGTTTWGAVPGSANTNWHASSPSENNLTPVAGADVLFGDKPLNNGPTNSQHVALSSDVNVRNLTFDSHINYSIGSVGDGRTLTFGNTSQAGLPSINVNDYNGAHARHKINSDIRLIERIAIQNYSASILCLNGTFDTAGNAITVNGTGAVNFNGALVGSGDLTKNGPGITTINHNNAATWTGDVTINGGQLVVTKDGALGAAGGTIVEFKNQTTATTTVSTTVLGGQNIYQNGNHLFIPTAAIPPGGFVVGSQISGTNIPPGTIITAISTESGKLRLTLSNNLTAFTGTGTFTISGPSTSSVSEGGTPGSSTTSTANTITSGPLTATVSAYNPIGWGQVSDKLLIQPANIPAGGFQVGQPVTGGKIAPGTYITAITWRPDGHLEITLSSPTLNGVWYENVTFGLNYSTTVTTTVASNTVAVAETVTLPGGATTVNDGGTLTFRGGVDYTAQEGLTISGLGHANTPGKHLGAIYNDGGNNSFAGDIILAASAAVGSRDGTLTLSGTISGGAGKTFTKLGAGTVALTGSTAGLWDGAFAIQDGALRVDATSFNTAMNYQLAGGVLEIAGDLDTDSYIAATSHLSISLGDGNYEIQWTGDGGFSAFGADRAIYLNWNTDSLTWGGTEYFVGDGHALLFGSKTSTHTATLMNGINLNGAQREVRVADGSAAVDGALAGALTGTGGLVKTGDGTLALTSAGNTYSGATEIRAGALRGNLSANSNLQLNGGVRELNNASTTLTLGEAGGQVRWTGDGGFAAQGNNVTLTLDVPGTSNDSLTWGSTGATANFVAGDKALIFGSRSADKTLTLANNLALGGTTSDTRTIRTIRGTDSSVASGALSGVVSGAATLAVTGDGRLDLTADNTHTGAITVTGAELRLSGANGDLAQSSGFTVRQGGTLTLDNSAALRDRVGDSAGVTLSGGTLALVGRNAAGGDHTEDIGTLSLAAGANTVRLTRSNDDSYIRLAADSLSRSAGATVDFAVTGGTLGSATGDNNPRITFTSATPALDDGILAYATINGTDFATYDANGIAAASYSNASQTNWNSSTNLSASSASSIDASRHLNSLRLVDSANLNLNGHQLAIESGGLLTTGAGGVTISNGHLTTNGANDFVVHAYNTGGTTLSAVIGGSAGLVKSGEQTLTFSGTSANTYTGTTTVNAGTLVLAKSDNVTAVAGNLVVGDGRGIDTLRLDANEQIANTASVTLRGGEVGNSANVARLEMHGAADDTYASRVERFASLNIEGNTVLDFGGGTPCSPTFLYLDFLNVAANSLLTITNWIEFTDFLLVSKAHFDASQLSRVIFDGYDNAASWKEYDSDYYQIIPFAPVPEPATYGVLSLGGLVGLIATRRRRRPATASN